ncbi:chemotaxis protein histidine kinase CheA [Flavobacterium arsenatis]|uniref:Chemotaxis protein histidine kinase CheA n=1 Tax=Flavobacterium arsenatis TaxID=1484332 RepID=A0ABU1TRZ7_9FLAO|nr:hypothetical protein [Flavobacterium arsenatis]MDR6968644.1 chemotaxis protein histidine kinase CheA [Flavobacterium arsenatis]
MKKKLEAELISIAHRILKLKNKSELVQLHQETQKLYEKLSVLKFVEENFGDVKPTIGYKEVEEKLEATFDEKEEVVAEETSVNEEVEETMEAETPEEVVSEVEEDETETADETPEEEVEEEKGEEPSELAEEETPEEDVSEAEKQAVAESEDEEESIEVEKEKESSVEEDKDEEPSELAEEETPEEEVSEVEKEAVAESEDEEEPTLAEKEETSVEEEEQVETSAQTKTEEKKEHLFEPTFELAFDKKEDVEEVAKESGHQIIFEDFLGSDYKELEFVKAEIEKSDEEPEPVNAKVVPEIEETKDVQVEQSVKKNFPEAPQYEGIKITKGITFGLNDKVGFVSQLFGGSNEDFNRVISQLNTFNTFQDAKNFIEDLVKPDYNDWKGKEDFEERFLEVVEQKFK